MHFDASTIKDITKSITAYAHNHGYQVDCVSRGNVNAELAIVSDYPGAREVETKTPMSGRAGDLLRRTLNAEPHPISFQAVYITNAYKRYVGVSRKGGVHIEVDENDFWRDVLFAELASLPNLKLIVCAGSLALSQLLGLDRVMSRRGSVYEQVIGSRVMKVLVTINPAAGLPPLTYSKYEERDLSPEIIKAAQAAYLFSFDIRRAKHILQHGWPTNTIQGDTNPSPNAAIAFIDKLISEKKPIAYDIETPTNGTACIGLANEPNYGMCINFMDENGSRWTSNDEVSVRDALARLAKFSREGTTTFIAQNAMFDNTRMWFYDRLAFRCHFDTMLAHHLVYPTLPHSLEFITSYYTTHPYYKEEREASSLGNMRMLWDYNIRDACILIQIVRPLLQHLRQENLAKFFNEHVMPLNWRLIRTTIHGQYVDIERRQKHADDSTKRSAELLAAFNQTVAETLNLPSVNINPNSPKQLDRLLYGMLRLRSKKGTTGKEDRAEMRKHTNDPSIIRMLTTLDEYKKESKFRSTYTSYPLDADNRFRCEYNQRGTTKAPGRLSSTENSWGTSRNGQNQPRRVRDIFCADPGYVLVYFDLSQAEARVIAWRFNIQAWINQFERARIDHSYDCHRALAADMWHVEYDLVPTYDHDPETGKVSIRYTAKRCRHGLNYRMQRNKLASVTGLPDNEAFDAFTRYHKITPELSLGWEATEFLFSSQGYLTNAFGRKLRIPNVTNPSLVGSIIAFYPQSTIGDKTCEVHYKSEMDRRWPKDAIVLRNDHDSLTAQCRPDDAEHVAQIFRRYAEAPMQIECLDYTKGVKLSRFYRELVIPAEVAFSQPDENGVHRLSSLKKAQGEIELIEDIEDELE